MAVGLTRIPTVLMLISKGSGRHLNSGATARNFVGGILAYFWENMRIIVWKLDNRREVPGAMC